MFAAWSVILFLGPWELYGVDVEETESVMDTAQAVLTLRYIP